MGSHSGSGTGSSTFSGAVSASGGSTSDGYIFRNKSFLQSFGFMIC